MSPAPITRAVITVAGHGTRMLPATKSMPKEMLPIINKPVIQHIVEELVDAGIKQIIMVTSWQKRAIEDHFDRSFELEHSLEQQGKMELLETIRGLRDLADFIYIRQKPIYGNGVPAISAKPVLNNEPFVYVLGDDLVKSEIPFTAQMLQLYEKTESPIIGVQEVDESEVHKYGIVETTPHPAGDKIIKITEKPKAQDTSSRLAIFGRYILTPDIIEMLENVPLGRHGELWLTDGLEELIQKRDVFAQPIQNGKWLTTGDPLSWLITNLEYGLEDPQIKDGLTAYLQQKLLH